MRTIAAIQFVPAETGETVQILMIIEKEAGHEAEPARFDPTNPAHKVCLAVYKNLEVMAKSMQIEEPKESDLPTGSIFVPGGGGNA